MIKVTTIDGRTHFLSPGAIAIVSQSGNSGAWHGINSYVKTFEGRLIEVRETPEEINEAIQKERNGL